MKLLQLLRHSLSDAATRTTAAAAHATPMRMQLLVQRSFPKAFEFEALPATHELRFSLPLESKPTPWAPAANTLAELEPQRFVARIRDGKVFVEERVGNMRTPSTAARTVESALQSAVNANG